MMVEEETKQLLKLARQKFGSPDFLISVYSMQFIWVSERAAQALGYTQQEFFDISVHKVMVFDKEEIMKMVTKFLGKQKEDTKVLRKKTGEKVRVKGMVNSFTRDKEPYLVITNLKLI